MTTQMGIQADLALHYSDFSLSVNVALPSHGVTALFGSSGSGKSTFLRCVAGLEKAKGTLIVNGETWQDDNVFLPPHQRPIGFVFQEATLFPHMNVMANLQYGMKRQSQAMRISLEHTIDLLGIEPILNRKPDKLSGGEKQRVAIARALAVNPKVLLMDEPLSALDVARKREIMPFLEKLHDSLSIPVLYVTHAPNEVARLADYMIVLNQGQVVASGSLNETISHINQSLQPDNQVSVIVEAKITEIDEQWHLAKVNFNQGAIWLRDQHFSLAQTIRFSIMASDVSIALTANYDSSSISNVLQAVVDEISPGDHPAITFVRLKLGETYLISRLTKRSLTALDIQQGDTVWAQIKSAAIVE